MADGFRSLAFRLGVLAMSLAVNAGASSEPVAAEPKLHFTVFSVQTPVGLAYEQGKNGACQSVVFYPTTRSPRYDFSGEGPLRFRDENTGACVAEVPIPRGLENAFLLFEPLAAAAPGEARYRVHLFDERTLGEGAGNLGILNLSGFALTGTIDRRTVSLREGFNPPCQLGRSAKVILRVTAKGRQYQAYADTIRLDTRGRALLILFPPYYPGTLELQSRLLIDEVNDDSGGTQRTQRRREVAEEIKK